MTDVDLQLVLAIDSSGSVDANEYALQLEGIAAAFRDEEVVAAALSGTRKRVAVTLMSWADGALPKYSTGWSIIASAEDAEVFAATVARYDRKAYGYTGIGAAIVGAIDLMDRSGIVAARRIIDVSGDGEETLNDSEAPILLPAAHEIRQSSGVTVNGLAITINIPNLDQYYQRAVIGGPGSFVIKANDYEDYGEAIRKKLLREFQPMTAQRPE